MLEAIRSNYIPTYVFLSSTEETLPKVEDEERSLSTVIDISEVKESSKARLRRAEIAEQVEHWRPFVDDFEGSKYTFEVNPVGCASSYFLVDEEGVRRYMVKPVDEEIGALNNREGLASDETGFFFVEHIPLYRSAQTDAMAYRLACIAGLGNITPKAEMAIIRSDAFYDCSGKSGMVQEKLCSIQEYIPDTCMLWDIRSRMEESDTFDQRDFEQANLFVWLTFDNDAHAGNFLAYFKEPSKEGQRIVGLYKVDNAFSFPEQNSGLWNMLAHMPEAEKPLSDEAYNLLQNLDVDAIKLEMKNLELDAAIPAFESRVASLQEITQDRSLTIEQINDKLLERERCW